MNWGSDWTQLPLGMLNFGLPFGMLNHVELRLSLGLKPRCIHPDEIGRVFICDHAFACPSALTDTR